MNNSNDPLNKEEKEEFIQMFAKIFEKEYESLLLCGGLSEDIRSPGNHFIAKVAILKAAKNFDFLDKEYKKESRNLMKF